MKEKKEDKRGKGGEFSAAIPEHQKKKTCAYFPPFTIPKKTHCSRKGRSLWRLRHQHVEGLKKRGEDIYPTSSFSSGKRNEVSCRLKKMVMNGGYRPEAAKKGKAHCVAAAACGRNPSPYRTTSQEKKEKSCKRRAWRHQGLEGGGGKGGKT